MLASSIPGVSPHFAYSVNCSEWRETHRSFGGDYFDVWNEGDGRFWGWFGGLTREFAGVFEGLQLPQVLKPLTSMG